MSLLYGYDVEDSDDEESVVYNRSCDSPVKPLNTSIEFKHFNKLRTVVVLNSSIVLLGIETTSTHSGIVYYDIYNSGRTIPTEKIQAHDEDYFEIKNKNALLNPITPLRKVYAPVGPSSITVRMGNTNSDRISPLKNTLVVNVILHYIEIPSRYLTPTTPLNMKSMKKK